MRTVSVLNLKGGVGKTTTAVNLAAAAYHAGRRVLLVDLDTQGSASAHLGVGDVEVGLGDVLLREASVREAAVRLEPNEGGGGERDSAASAGQAAEACLDLVPSGGVRLQMARTELAARHSKNRLRSVFEGGCVGPDGAGYDLAVLDVAPGLDALWLNALYAADLVVCPVELQMAALVGLRGFREVLEFAEEEDGFEVPVLYLPTNDDGRVAESRELKAVLEEQYGAYPEGRVLPSVRYSSALSKAVGARQSVFDYDPTDRGAADHARLAVAVLQEVGA
jgi:chromosome partitioning protein